MYRDLGPVTKPGYRAPVAFVLAFVGLVALVQGVAWLGSTRTSPARRGLGSVLAPLGLLLLSGAVVHLLVPGFWTLS